MTIGQINFAATKDDADIIQKIAVRAVSVYKRNGLRIKLMDVAMDITATHLNGCPLKLKELLEADDFNFIHDISGISGHIDRETGKLTRCFDPRFSA
jgi:hypothetical protein